MASMGTSTWKMGTKKSTNAKICTSTRALEFEVAQMGVTVVPAQLGLGA
ncbi:hypothetical protein PVAP13_5KG241500 [Panicum virgatum]|uniref:Uncharacterized protein n=1 Tax=Panicum virgatum TaxID=38727 RepID=A0A8T0SHL4_PANVG|nr:hypothetical protein PVAP13_5KG241500 [Panicum virgatum]